MNLDNIQITKDCVKEINNLTSTTYVNICNGTTHNVPYGVGEYLSVLLVGGVFIGIVVMCFTMVYKMLTDF